MDVTVTVGEEKFDLDRLAWHFLDWIDAQEKPEGDASESEVA